MSRWFIVTAAHCVWEEKSDRVPVKDVRIHVGTVTDKGGKVYKLNSYALHPNFDHVSDTQGAMVYLKHLKLPLAVRFLYVKSQITHHFLFWCLSWHLFLFGKFHYALLYFTLNYLPWVLPVPSKNICVRLPAKNILEGFLEIGLLGESNLVQ